MRVILIDDVALFRDGLASLLTTVGIDVVAHAGSAEEGLAQIDRSPSDVVVMDIRMPPTYTDEGIVAARELKAKHPGLGVLVLSGYADATWATRLLEGHMGGVGYLLKENVGDVHALQDALTRIAEGELVVDPKVVAMICSRRATAEKLADLSERERDVLAHIAQGRSNARIADQLNVAVKTVEANVAAIFSKLGLLQSPDDNRRVLAALAWLRSRPL
jgi:DNA-binding NarL/FixJ family response regulator